MKFVRAEKLSRCFQKCRVAQMNELQGQMVDDTRHVKLRPADVYDFVVEQNQRVTRDEEVFWRVIAVRDTLVPVLEHGDDWLNFGMPVTNEFKVRFDPLLTEELVVAEEIWHRHGMEFRE